MELTQIILQVITALVNVLAIFQKEKWKILFYYTMVNIVFVAMYFSFGRTVAALICLVSVLRTLLYMIFAIKKIKPNFWIFLVFEIAYILIAIFTWQDAYDTLPLIAILAGNFASWQDNHLVFRIGYIINESCYVAYNLIISAYIAMGVEILNLICTITCLIYYCILKKEKPIFDVIFGRKQKTNQDGLQESIMADDSVNQDSLLKKE